ncbi:hypothetical protein I4U23_031034 [Adineta vaga]|nr:hypothetical protein I4U23_031034 [Adineta vaga]
MATELPFDFLLCNSRKNIVPSVDQRSLKVRSRSADQIYQDRRMIYRNQVETNRRDLFVSLMEKELHQKQTTQRIRTLRFLNNLHRKHPLANDFLPQILSSDPIDLLDQIDIYSFHIRKNHSNESPLKQAISKHSSEITQKISNEKTEALTSKDQQRFTSRRENDQSLFPRRYQQLQFARRTHQVTKYKPTTEEINNVIRRTKLERVRSAYQAVTQTKIKDLYQTQQQIKNAHLSTRIDRFLKQ